jgi:hypothetical protein
MAVQFHVSHSRHVNGSAIFAGGPFYCAESNLEFATNKCMSTSLGTPATETLIALTHTDASLGLVDPPYNLHDSRVYLFSGKDDSVVDTKVMKSLEQYYLTFLPSKNLLANFDINAEHCIPTIDYGEDCTTLSSPYIGKCGFDGAKAALEQVYGKSLNPPKEVSANLFKFDQTPFFVQNNLTSIGDVGYVYIPTACQGGSAAFCRLHISFHGCQQNLELIGPKYAQHAGFNGYAETNNIIVLYPYVKVSQLTPYNPKGCWDWWAYTGVYYGTKVGVQVEFVWKMATLMGISS